MKAILEFNLPDERLDFEIASHANEWRNLAWDLSMFLRDKIKYQELPEGHTKLCEIIQKELFDNMNARNLTFDE